MTLVKMTIDLPDELAHEAEAKGAQAGQSLKEMLTEGLRLLLARGESLPNPARKSGGGARPESTSWDRLCASYQDPFPELTAMQMLDEFRGPVELPPAQP